MRTEKGNGVENTFRESIDRRTLVVGIVGLGYVGLPLVLAFGSSNFRIAGFDVDAEKVRMLRAGESYIQHIPAASIRELNGTGRVSYTTDFSEVGGADVLLLCVPTPLTTQREPDMSYVEQTVRAIAPHVRKGHLVILESTTYPGTTRELMLPILEDGGLKEGEDFFLAYSPEREDPGNIDFNTTRIPKVVGGCSQESRARATYLYEQIVPRVIEVSSAETAEAVKLTENIFRAVNIALVNELKMVYTEMGIDVWEVIEAAKTKPFGYMPFYPGPGLGGHCIPIDPFYLTWKAREFGCSTRFIELAGEINVSMPDYVIHRLVDALNDQCKPLKNSRILVVGLAYKKNVDDLRESPSLVLIDRLGMHGALVDYHDPHIPAIKTTRRHPSLAGMESIPLNEETLKAYDAALIATDHDTVDYAKLVETLPLIVDTRNAIKPGQEGRAVIVKA